MAFAPYFSFWYTSISSFSHGELCLVCDLRVPEVITLYGALGASFLGITASRAGSVRQFCHLV